MANHDQVLANTLIALLQDRGWTVSMQPPASSTTATSAAPPADALPADALPTATSAAPPADALPADALYNPWQGYAGLDAARSSQDNALAPDQRRVTFAADASGQGDGDGANALDQQAGVSAPAFPPPPVPQEVPQEEMYVWGVRALTYDGWLGWSLGEWLQYWDALPKDRQPPEMQDALWVASQTPFSAATTGPALPPDGPSSADALAGAFSQGGGPAQDVPAPASSLLCLRTALLQLIKLLLPRLLCLRTMRRGSRRLLLRPILMRSRHLTLLLR